MRAEKLDFRLLGPLEVWAGGEPLPLGGAKQRATLAVLLVHANEPVSPDRLIDALWGERPPETAKTALQGCITQLRRLLEPSRKKRAAGEVLVTTPAGYVLHVAEGALDSSRFESLAARGHAALAAGRAVQATDLLRSALALWRGPALGEFAYESWAQTEADRLAELRLVSLEQLIEAELELGHHAELVGELEALVSEQPLRERPRALLMLALYRAGRQAEALEAYQEARGTLVDELGIDPSPELRELEAAILRQDAELAAPTPDARRPTNLPAPPTPLVGRERELAEVGALLAEGDVRLLTLTGAGGSGKTRLALALAERLADRYAHGARLVPLAPVSDPGALLPTVAAALEVSEEPGRALGESLVAALAEWELLLVLDNFEHLVEAAQAVADLLAASPHLTLLVTSRAPLRLAAEQEYAVPPLDEDEGVALFLARARAHDPALVGDQESARAVVRRLDGLPLALELAAARVRTLGLDGLRGRLEQALPLLTGGPRDAPERQQTLRATIEWSERLLADQQRSALARVSVFAGGFTVDAVEQVAGARLEELEALVEHSLLRPVGEGRFSLLHVVREYAAGRLEESGEVEEDQVRQAHALHYLALVEAGEPEILAGRDVPVWLSRFDLEYHNLLAALSWARSAGASELELRLAASASRFWYLRGRLHEGRELLDGALERAADAPPTLRAKALRGAFSLAFAQGDYGAARSSLEQALALYRELGDQSAVARMLSNLGAVASVQGDLDSALSLHEDAVALLRELGEAGTLAGVLNNLASVASDRGDFDRAVRVAEESADLYRQAGDDEGLTVALLNRGYAELERGDLDAAREALAESLRTSLPVGAVVRIVPCLDALAALSARSGEPTIAARLLGATDLLSEESEVARQPYELDLRARTEKQLRNALGEDALAAATAEGRTLDANAAAELALSDGVEP